MPIRAIRANFIEARRETSLHKQAGYTEAILSLSSITQRLAKWEETIYGLIIADDPWLIKRMSVIHDFGSDANAKHPKRHSAAFTPRFGVGGAGSILIKLRLFA